MSVNTEADVALEKTREHISDAVDALAEIVVHECSGSDIYNCQFRRDLRQSLSLLMDVRDKLK